MTSSHSSARSLEGAFTLLASSLQAGVAEAGYCTPTPIQEQAIPPILEGRDLIGTAQTGTGKTAAFVLPLLQRLPEASGKGRSPRALILAPTRELAIQIGESLETYGRSTSHVHTVIFGGVSQFHQVKAIRKGVDVLVATPGRLLDLMSQEHVTLEAVQFFVLDEMDRMLDMGFLPDIKRILKQVPDQRQTLFFSATMSRRIEQIASNMVKNPVRVAIAPDEPAVDRIQQRVMFVEPSDKLRVLVEQLEETSGKAIVFLQMKHAANKVVDRLSKAGIEATAIHGNKSQNARVRALDGFRGDRYQVLVATDVAARGIDVDNISLVVNYDMPVEAETYVHRIGRTARAGAEGEAVSLCSPMDRAYLTAIEKLLGKEVPVDEDHPYHSEEARVSTLKPRVPGQGRRGPHPKNRSRNKPSQRRDRRRRR